MDKETTRPESGALASFSVSAPNVFDYHDYREYLRDVISVRRRNDPGYTLAKFSKVLGFSSHSGLVMILSGKRDLQTPYLDKCLKNLNLKGKERLYFESLVRHGDLTPAKRVALLKEMEFHTTSWDPPVFSDGIRLIDFFLVQQVLSLYRTSVSLEVIRGHFRYPMEAREVLRILDWMIERGYVERVDGGYRVQKSVLMIQDEIPNSSGKQLHRDCLKLAAAALEDPLEEREFQTYLMTVDSRRFAEMKQRIKKMVLEVFSEYETELDGDTVIQFHFNLFKASKDNLESAHA